MTDMVIAASNGWRQGTIVMAALWMLVLAGPARAGVCPPAGKDIAQPPVRLIVEAPIPAYGNSLSRRQLAAIGHGNTLDSHHAGLTQTKTAFSVEVRLSFFRLPEGRFCVQLTQLEANWRATQLQVDIAREYRPGTCPYREVLDHENQHVLIAQTQFAVAERKLRSRLIELASGFRPYITTATVNRAKRDVAASFMAGVQNVLNSYRVESERANALIDTQENYRRVTSRCADW